MHLSLQLILFVLSLVEPRWFTPIWQLCVVLFNLLMITTQREVGMISPTKIVSVGVRVILNNAHKLWIMWAHFVSMWFLASNTINCNHLIYCIYLVSFLTFTRFNVIAYIKSIMVAICACNAAIVSFFDVPKVLLRRLSSSWFLEIRSKMSLASV